MAKYVFLSLILFESFVHASNLCRGAEVANVVSAVQKVNRPEEPCGDCSVKGSSEWELAWSDEFTYSGRPDAKRWKHETGGWGWGNEEDQFYTKSEKNSYVKNGRLVIKAIQEKFENRSYTSAKLNSAESFVYGRFVVRAKMPRGRGTWGAAWLLADDKIYGEQLWPDNGEIDILEMVGHEGTLNHASTHTKDYNFQMQSQYTATTLVPNGDSEFHEYQVDWLPNRIDFFVDGKKYLTVAKEPNADWRKWPFDQKFHLNLNLAIGGFWGGQHGIDNSMIPATMEVDYVRIYRPPHEECMAPPPKVDVKKKNMNTNDVPK